MNWIANFVRPRIKSLMGGRASETPDNLWRKCPSCGEKHLQQELSTFAAHANGAPKAEMPSCPSGRCSNPGMCGMN